MTRYNAEFKTQAVQLALTSDRPYSHSAKELGIDPKNLYNWIKLSEATKVSTGKLTAKQELGMENIQLRKLCKRQQQELEILKKAAAYFAKHQK
jgi:transposase|tara:strand:+ start:56 stop:337 length:282 start_codon:yes stop_codon:yes gene_type:complete